MRRPVLLLIAGVFAAIPLHPQQDSSSIEVPAGARAVLEAHGDGVQIYSCVASRSAVQWLLKAPDAKLLDASGKVIGRHFAGPTWRLDDGSQVQGELIASRPSPDPGSVAWLLLRAKAESGRAAGQESSQGALHSVAFIRRTETHGGAAPATGCTAPPDAGKTVQIPYSATYTFYSEK